MRRLLTTLLLFTAFVAVGNAQDKLYANEFPLGDVTLLDGPLKRARDLNVSELQACADANAKNHPEWGRGYVGGVPGSDRIWSAFKKGDVIDIAFPMYNYVKYLPNLPQYIALMHGPVMLAMKTGTEDLAMLVADDSRFGQLAVGKKLPVDQAPILINNDIEGIANQLQPVPGKPLHFTLSTKMVNEIRNELMPFFELHDARYMMYWLALTEDNYQGYLDNLARQEQEHLALEARTTDKVQPGEQQPESDHFMETDAKLTLKEENDDEPKTFTRQ